ncbi:MAG: hypothetical protein HY301_11990 [Verrucomicrobia bacterium]|nr:hypothetical protein [Verrucomicrobiota bacterium]
MLRQLLLAGVLALATFATAAAEPAATPGEEPLLRVLTFTEKTVRLPVLRAIITAQTNRFSLVVPFEFHVGGDANTKKVTLVSDDGNCVFTISVHESFGGRPLPSLKPEPARASALSRIPGAKVLAEYTLNVLQYTGPVFDLEKDVANGTPLLGRFALIPYANGVLEFQLNSTGPNAGQHVRRFNEVISSLRISPLTGELEVLRIENEI